MRLGEAAEYLKQNIPMTDVLALYGYPVNRSGFARCPFHAGDHSPSLKIYTSGSRRGWYCFGCHAGGSVLDFVMKHDSCDFATAVRALDRALSLNLLAVVPWQEEEEERKRQRLLDQAERALLDLLDIRKSHIMREYDLAFKEWYALERKPRAAWTASEWTRWQNDREQMDYLDDQCARLDAERGEVRAWRSRCRLRGTTAT